ncbi:uncharacterized protein LOC142908304 [Petromyzon marinus]|uniref:uncharacterized protein LOC142908304 n=1 Tax=Petromyzon marinus TaxID=7757 RepID=UPI003F6EA56D
MFSYGYPEYFPKPGKGVDGDIASERCAVLAIVALGWWVGGGAPNVLCYRTPAVVPSADVPVQLHATSSVATPYNLGATPRYLGATLRNLRTPSRNLAPTPHNFSATPHVLCATPKQPRDIVQGDSKREGSANCSSIIGHSRQLTGPGNTVNTLTFTFALLLILLLLQALCLYRGVGGGSLTLSSRILSLVYSRSNIKHLGTAPNQGSPNGAEIPGSDGTGSQVCVFDVSVQLHAASCCCKRSGGRADVWGVVGRIQAVNGTPGKVKTPLPFALSTTTSGFAFVSELGSWGGGVVLTPCLPESLASPASSRCQQRGGRDHR